VITPEVIAMGSAATVGGAASQTAVAQAMSWRIRFICCFFLVRFFVVVPPRGVRVRYMLAIGRPQLTPRSLELPWASSPQQADKR
jgi:hypothetical protein